MQGVDDEFANSKFHLWIVDDCEDICEVCFELLKDDFTVSLFNSAGKALQNLSTVSSNLKPDVILTDYRMPAKNGLEFICEAKRIDADLTFMIMTGAANFNLFQEAFRLGVSGVVEKPFDFNHVRNALRCAVLKKMMNVLAHSIVNSADDLMNKVSALMSLQFERLVEAENNLFNCADYWEQLTPSLRSELLNGIYKENALHKVIEDNKLRLSKMIFQHRYMKLLLEDK